jgi:hypothetical protein
VRLASLTRSVIQVAACLRYDYDRMADRSVDPTAALQARGQALLVEFLHTDLDLAFTFLETARIETGSDDAHAKAALRNAQTALGSIRHFQGRVEDPAEWGKIQSRTDKLEAAISVLDSSS